ncbi:L,D-transpeptidase [Loigolactobacillus jiayinensis]|uniref:L,D-transpeptidase n=1 Tax=Loigolactobacillus jiayinensis TaxID=2486016 RepID=A0ABW1RHG8_9LACO|nr:L,D-transpeptidase [Loigolactobacillus jiayinensis]
MKRFIKMQQLALIVVLAVILLGLGYRHVVSAKQVMAPQVESTVKSSTKQKTTTKAAKATNKTTATKKTIDWHAPSEKKAYPDLKQHPKAWLEVSQSKQRVYVKDGNKVLYTMYASTGLDNTTPNGTFTIEAERGASFFNRSLNEGANYWTSWSGHGVYLFHSVPTDAAGKYNVTEAKKLGQKASHGCVRLTIADAKWINTYIPFGTKVVVHN